MNFLSMKYSLEKAFLKASKEEAFGNPLLIEVSPPDVSGRLSQNICMVLDKSGSMAGPKIESAKRGACGIIDRLVDNDYFSLVIFNDEIIPLIQSEQITNQKKEEVKDTINNIEADGETDISDALEKGLDLLKTKLSPASVNSLILLSDGQPNKGFTQSSDFEPLVNEAKNLGINIHAYGLGDDHNPVILSSIGGQNFSFVTDPDSIPNLFGESLGHFENIVIRNLKLEIQIADRSISVTPGTSFLAKPGREFLKKVNLDPTNWSISFPLLDLEKGQPQSYLIQLSCPPNPSLGPKELATINLTFDIPSQKKFQEKTSLVVTAEYTSDSSKFNKKNREVRYIFNACMENRLVREASEYNEKGEKAVNENEKVENKAKALSLFRQVVVYAKELSDSGTLQLAQGQIDKLSKDELLANKDIAELMQRTK